MNTPADRAIRTDRALVPDQIAEHFREVEPEFARRIADAQVFDFGDIQIEGERLPYIMELFARGFIDVPYPTVLYRCAPSPDRWALLIERDLIPDAPATKSFHVFAYVYLPSLERFELMVIGDVGFHQADEARVEWHFQASRELPQPSADEAGKMTAGLFLQCSLLLTTEGLPRRVEEEPVRLNAKRARTGKPRIPAITYIDFQAYAKAAAEHGHHGSPVPHLRRGHLRRYEDGRMTFVRDCIVNASPDVKVAKRDAYILDSRIAKTPKK